MKHYPVLGEQRLLVPMKGLCLLCGQPRANWRIEIEVNEMRGDDLVVEVHHACIREIPRNELLEQLLAKHEEKGQALVEFALILPVMCLILIGLFEVGWALHTHLIMTDVAREVGRFAIRSAYQGPNWQQLVEQHASETVVNDGLQSEAEFLITRYDSAEDCATPIITQTLQFRVPATNTRVSRETQRDLEASVRDMGCWHASTNGHVITSTYEDGTVITGTIEDYQNAPNTMVVVEVFLDQPQLFGFFNLTNRPLLVPQYTHVVMRIIQDTRE